MEDLLKYLDDMVAPTINDFEKTLGPCGTHFWRVSQHFMQ
jgi:hypothetical protein